MRRGRSRILQSMLGGASTNPHAIVVLTVPSGCLLFTSPSPCPETPQSQSMNSVETSISVQNRTNQRELSSDVTVNGQLTYDTSCCRCAAHDLSLISKVKHAGFDIEPFFFCCSEILGSLTTPLRSPTPTILQRGLLIFENIGFAVVDPKRDLRTCWHHSAGS